MAAQNPQDSFPRPGNRPVFLNRLNKVIAASKASAAEEEEKRKKEVPTTASSTTASTPAESTKEKENGHEKAFGSIGLSRTHKGSKSMSRKSFGFLSKNGDGKSDDTAVEGEPGPQTPEKHAKTTKDRFSFSGLGRKKSNLNP